MLSPIFKPAQLRGIIVFLVLLLIFHLSVDAYLDKLSADRMPSSGDLKAFTEMIKAHKELRSSKNRMKPYSKTINPNEATKEELVASGLSEWLSERLIKFRETGASFKEIKDLERIYGMDSNWLRERGNQLLFNLDGQEAGIFQHNKEKELALDTFNPNLVSKQELENMHLPQRVVKGILSFRSKYRPFQELDDIYKVYGIDTLMAQQIEPFLKIKGQESQDSLNLGVKILALNKVDTMILKTVPGIGSYLANAIIEYRSALGGFHTVEQLRDLFLIDSSRFNQISKSFYCDSIVKKININAASCEDLAKHPYISFKLARNICEFRERMRLFRNREELMNIELVDGVLFSKLAPYLEIR